jgi:hypothetical protein
VGDLTSLYDDICGGSSPQVVWVGDRRSVVRQRFLGAGPRPLGSADERDLSTSAGMDRRERKAGRFVSVG